MKYTIVSDGKPDTFESRVSKGDVVKYELDFTPWLEGKGTIASTEWTIHSGSVAISDTDQTAYLTFNYEGSNLVSCKVTTSTGEAKKVWLVIKVIDRDSTLDYENS